MSRRIAIVCAVALSAGALAGCATASAPALTATAPGRVVGGGLEGKQLDAALGRYGAWAEQIKLGETRTYIWRRSYVAANQAYYCELWVETGFRQTIAHTSMQGAPGACRLFSAKLENRGE